MAKSMNSNKHNLLVNIDTVELEIDGADFSNCTKVEVSVTDTETGEIRSEYGNRVAVQGKNSIHNMQIRTWNRGQALRISGSPYASRYGQNLFTYSDLQRACRIAINRVVKIFEVKPSKEVLDDWLSGECNLSRVDLAVNLKLSSEKEVVQVLQQLRRYYGELAVTTKTNRSSFYFTPRDGKEYGIGFYAKGDQVRRAQCYRKAAYRSKLIEEARCILRVELRLRRKELIKLGLQKASAWEASTAAQVFSKYMAKLKLKNATSGPATNAEFAKLPSRLRHVLAAHKAGYDLSTIYEERTLQRHLSDFRNRKLDLRCPNQPAGTKVSLLKFVSPKRVINQVPVWMQKLGIAPSERGGKKRVTKG